MRFEIVLSLRGRSVFLARDVLLSTTAWSGYQEIGGGSKMTCDSEWISLDFLMICYVKPALLRVRGEHYKAASITPNEMGRIRITMSTDP